MKINPFYFLLLVSFIAFTCCKDDEVVNGDPDVIRLAFSETSEIGMPMLKTYNTDDILADTTRTLTRAVLDLLNSNTLSFPDSIVFLSDELSYFDAASSGFLSTQSNLDSIPYTLMNGNFEFNVTSLNNTITATGTREEVTIPYRTFIKKGIGNSGSTHLPVSYNSFLFNDFLPGDSLVYIQYNVIYR